MGMKGGEVGETGLSKEVASARERVRADLNERWRPLQSRYIADVMDTSDETARAQADTTVARAEAFDRVRDRNEVTLARVGARPGSGRHAKGIVPGADEGIAGGKQAVASLDAVESGAAGRKAVVAARGMQQRDEALFGLDNLATVAEQRAQADAAAKRASSSGLIQTGLTLAGMAAGGPAGAKVGSVAGQAVGGSIEDDATLGVV